MPPFFHRSSNPIAFYEKIGCSLFGNRIFEYQERHLSKIMATCWRLSVANTGETSVEMRERKTRGAIFETTKGGHVSSMSYFFAQKCTVPPTFYVAARRRPSNSPIKDQQNPVSGTPPITARSPSVWTL